MERSIMRRRGREFCQLEIRLVGERFTICGTAGVVLSEREARRESRDFWTSFFEEADNLAEFNERWGRRFRSPEGAARHLIGCDGDFSGLDVVREDDGEVYVAHSCGQIRDEIADFFPEAVPYFRWHLNDLHAECEHQEARGESYHTHPGAECPDCGWRLGHGWHKRELPEHVVEWAETFGLGDDEVAA